MTTSLEEKKRRRLAFMKALYDRTDGSQLSFQDMDEVGGELGWSREDTELVVEYLEAEGLVKFVAMGGVIAITHAGVVEVEQLVADPTAPTEHFPAISYYAINVQEMHGSQIQQGTVLSEQSMKVTSADRVADIATLIPNIREALRSADLPLDDAAEAEAELATIEAQTKSPRPKKGVLVQAISALNNVIGRATKTGANIIALAELVNRLQKLLPF